MTSVKLDLDGPVATLTLDRPDVRNAFDAALVSDLRDALNSLDGRHRVLVLTGAGDAFCAGADLRWMQASIDADEDENAREAAALGGLFRLLDASPRLVVGRINGSAFGGGVGLVACCDVAVGVAGARFAFSEVRLGLVPAVIAPVVLPKIGLASARRYFLTGEAFDAREARRLGLLHEVVDPVALDEVVRRFVDMALRNGPKAVAEAKQLIRQVHRRPPAEAFEYAVQTIARLRVSPEGQEGLRAFLEKRKPSWP